jgi:hypothetical protein
MAVRAPKNARQGRRIEVGMVFHTAAATPSSSDDALASSLKGKE